MKCYFNYVKTKKVYFQYSYQDITKIILRYSFYRNETHMPEPQKIKYIN